MRTALLQLNVTDDPEQNLPRTLEMVAEARAQGAEFVLTPEVTNCLSASRTRQREVLQPEAEDITLAGLREAAAHHSVWLLIGSLALAEEGPEGRFSNRSFLIGPSGGIVARYDKIHMFDVDVSETETYRESAGYRPGETAVLAHPPFAVIGMTVCYDLRFPHLYRRLAQGGAKILTVPSAFSPVTGAAHWEPLLRARAIECGAWVLAPAQCGVHRAQRGKERRTYGHSLVVSPWGEVLADGGEVPGITCVDLDMAAVEDARGRIPSLRHDREFEGPR
ncbi:carbon-nitrogen hydrolase family protein [Tropicimonas aquimaris]|uniref:Carbon-nitrogen hydrolase family protein n=1 Tax=Tropicimonas aquimaris TaxID=914152 RepID=A0ABW3IWK5_9RHOB